MENKMELFRPFSKWGYQVLCLHPSLDQEWYIKRAADAVFISQM
jgi:hypothetical protein